MSRPLPFWRFTYWGSHYPWRLSCYRDDDIDAWWISIGPIRIDTNLFYGEAA